MTITYKEPNGVRRTVLIWYGVSCILIVKKNNLYFIVSDTEGLNALAN